MAGEKPRALNGMQALKRSALEFKPAANAGNREAGATWHEEFSVTDQLHIGRKTWFVQNSVYLTVRGEPVEPLTTGIKPFDKLRANGDLFK